MKFSALTLFFASACVSGTAGFSAGYLSSLGGSDYSAPVASSTPKKNYSLTSWTPTGERRQAPNNGEAAVLDAVATADATTTSSTTIDLTNFLRNEYDAFVAYYGKIADEQRFKIFKDNYIRQWETDRVTGEYHFLNEYGDLTPEEYAQFAGGGAAAPTQPEAATVAPPQPSATKPQVVVKSLQSSFSGAFQSMSNPTHPYIQAESEPDDHDRHDKDFAVYRLNH